MLTVLNLLLLIAVVALGTYTLAIYDVCFTFGREGTAKVVVRGDVFDNVLLFWNGHRLNNPSRPDFRTDTPAWEVLETGDLHARASQYPAWKLHWRALERIGIYWYGLWPFKKIYRYKFEWSELKIGEDGQPKPWHRNEPTDFIYVKGFPYWVNLKEAEDKDNEPLNLDYLLTVRCNNPYKALFRIEDWLDRVTADSNNRAKVYVGRHNFNEIKREGAVDDTAMSGLTLEVCSINENLLTEPRGVGSPVSYGITASAAALVSVSTAGTVKEEVEQALVAKRVEELRAAAEVAKAKGEAKAAQERAKGEAKAIKIVYDQVVSYGNFGITMRSLDTLKVAASSPGSQTIWANNPFGGVSEWFKNVNVRLEASPSSPTQPPNE